MQLDDLVATVQRDLLAALPADSPAADEAERLASVLDSSLRLSITRALASAAEELSDDLPAGVVSVTLRADGTPRLRAEGIPDADPVSARPTGADTVTAPLPDVGHDDDADTARITLRLPARVKARAEDAADRAGMSTNRWLVRAVETALRPNPPHSAPRARSNHVSGWLN